MAILHWANTTLPDFGDAPGETSSLPGRTGCSTIQPEQCSGGKGSIGGVAPALKMAYDKQIQENLQDIVRHLVNAYHPLQIVLYGSFAWGAPHADSDIACSS